MEGRRCGCSAAVERAEPCADTAGAGSHGDGCVAHCSQGEKVRCNARSTAHLHSRLIDPLARPPLFYRHQPCLPLHPRLAPLPSPPSSPHSPSSLCTSAQLPPPSLSSTTRLPSSPLPAPSSPAPSLQCSRWPLPPHRPPPLLPLVTAITLTWCRCRRPPPRRPSPAAPSPLLSEPSALRPPPPLRVAFPPLLLPPRPTPSERRAAQGRPLLSLAS